VIERFFREARAAASVKSPYIVDIYDSGRLEDGRPFIAMEMLEGETLYDLNDAHPPHRSEDDRPHHQPVRARGS
jgi:serine/threonine protein kinase